jgi:hypothetical protein
MTLLKSLMFIAILFLQKNTIVCVSESLNRAVNSDSYKYFDQFYNDYRSLSESEQVQFALVEKNNLVLIEYQKKRFLKQPSVSLFFMQLQLGNILDGEYLETASENFSKFFYKNIKNSLITCGQIKGQDTLKEIIQSALFDEESAMKILEYVNSKNQKKNFTTFSMNTFLMHKINYVM